MLENDKKYDLKQGKRNQNKEWISILCNLIRTY